LGVQLAAFNDSCTGGCEEGCGCAVDGNCTCGEGGCACGEGCNCGAGGRLVNGIASGFCGPGCGMNGACGGMNGPCGSFCPNGQTYPEYPSFNQGPPTGQVAYPYYTTRGPRDFLARNPPSIGPY
jgi:hypothetical protein